MHGNIVVESGDNSTGLCMLWKEDVDVTLFSFSINHIDVEVRFKDDHFLFSAIYGFSDHRKKPKTWRLMDRIKGNSQLPWIIGGDFSEILSHNEKTGASAIATDAATAILYYAFEFKESSDHCFLLLDTIDDRTTSPNRGQDDYFKFENCWADEVGCAHTVRAAWLGSCGSTLDKLRTV
ncbi:hypothetical protein F3Y22_tig00111409pilonHSYRG00142 [Hibiscus syriacus]|uniref:Endonuclease/exonuclease/phosphatase domain-containing protein n=1 Tax=Hibiscus syriacus TaxID=106335 RepID=A0A6A2XPS1_HIBSY|nr:hypothetical protein F3Y22_tig00111409pilonHSYRG00142 [Hibiscus syriacus]